MHFSRGEHIVCESCDSDPFPLPPIHVVRIGGVCFLRLCMPQHSWPVRVAAANAATHSATRFKDLFRGAIEPGGMVSPLAWKRPADLWWSLCSHVTMLVWGGVRHLLQQERLPLPLG